MRGDQHVAPCLELGTDAPVPERQHACQRVLERLGRGQLAGRHARITALEARVLRVIRGQRRRRDVVAATPDLHLLGTVPGDRLRLVESLQRAVVALVEAPAALHRQPHHVELVERDPQRADRTLQHRREREVERDALGLEQSPGLFRLLEALRGQVHVDPAREQVLEVPDALAVAQQYQFAGAHVGGSYEGDAGFITTPPGSRQTGKSRCSGGRMTIDPGLAAHATCLQRVPPAGAVRVRP